ncbi:hypothetical protein [Microbulbifer sediminum]|uniref:hypothetical protein n=1 Tax=Microbulbifer sediminum TaxID=2904250 RepID=UPI001F395051|nr:hypothetical protein [Microbulbifer sediminum]
MKAYKKLLFTAVFFSSQAAMPALAQEETDSGDLDVEVTVVEANENAADAVNDIELPEEASDVARMAIEDGGLAVAEAARNGELGGDEEELEEAVEGAEEAAMNAEKALAEAAANANEAAREAINNALSGGASAEEILEDIPADVIESLPEDIQDQLNEVLENIPDVEAPEVETPEVDTPTGG